jgi:ketosteroid isomerase-like protein
MSPMNRASLLSLVPLLALAAACERPAPPPDPAEGIDALREGWVTHYNLHHPDMVAALYTSDAVVLNANQRVDEGRAAIEAGLELDMAGSPRATLTTGDRMIFGDHAVEWGTYRVDATGPDGDPMSFSGAYLVLPRREEGEWRIQGIITNYDSPRPEGWAWGEAGEAPPEESEFMDVIQDYATHWNLNHPDMVADFYHEEAVAAFPDQPVLHGKSAVAASLREQMEAAPSRIEIHGVGSLQLEDGWAVDGGWYALVHPETGDGLQAGAYVNLMERTADGSWRIRWSVVNGRPLGGM